MAKVLNPLMSSAARGRVGGLIFNQWRGLNTVKGFKSPSQPRTSRQLAIRAILTTLSRAWSGLTTVQRAGWESWADARPRPDWTGTLIRMTGENAYIACNSLLMDAGESAVDTAPSVVGPAAVGGLSVTPSSGTLKVDWTAPDDANTFVDLWLYGPHSPGRKPTIVKAVHNSYTLSSAKTKSITSLGAGVYTVYARTISKADGQRSMFISETKTVS